MLNPRRACKIASPPDEQREVDVAPLIEILGRDNGVVHEVKGGDRTSLELPAPQEQLLERVQATGKPLVLVLMNGSALGVNWADAHVPAIVEAWYPGEEGGTAVASLIAGDFTCEECGAPVDPCIPAESDPPSVASPVAEPALA